MKKETFVTVSEFARLVGVHKEVVMRMVKRGTLQAKKQKVTRYQISTALVDKFKAQRSKK